MKQRRVGTFTLGISLILIGIMVPLTMIFKDNALDILKFAPVVLLFLGAEILIYAFKFKEDKLKYDGLSIFIVLMVTLVTVLTASVAPIIKNVYTYENAVTEKRIEIENGINNALGTTEYNFQNNIHGNYSYNAFSGFNENQIKFTSDININVQYNDDEFTKENCAKILFDVTQLLKQNSDLSSVYRYTMGVYRDVAYEEPEFDENGQELHRDRKITQYRLGLTSSQLNNITIDGIEKLLTES